MLETPQPSQTAPEFSPKRVSPWELVGFALLFEGGMLPLGWGIEWLWPLPPTSPTAWRQLQQGQVSDLGWGLLGLGALLGVFYITELVKWREFERIRDILKQVLGETLVRASAVELFLVGMSAGFGEEFLFRGVLEPRLGWQWANLLFALLHPLSWVYMLLVYLLGACLSELRFLSQGLWAPILAHGGYDVVVLLILARRFRRQQFADESLVPPESPL